MNSRWMSSIVVLCAALLSGCGQQREGPSEEPKGSARAVEEETKEAVEAASSLARQKREEYQREIAAKLQALEAKIDELETKSRKAGERVQKKTKEAMDDLEEKRAAARERLEELESAGGEAWEDIKHGVAEAVEELEVAFEQAKRRFE